MSIDRREAFFGLIAPIGINLDAVEAAISNSLKRVGYVSNQVRLTQIFDEFPEDLRPSWSNEYDRYLRLIEAGDKLCRDSDRNDVFALYGIERLKAYSSRAKDDELPSQVVHVFRQIKRPDEIQTLKSVFGRNILFISCYSSKDDRKSYLVRKLLKTQRGKNKTELEANALTIMSTDENERGNPNGQRVIECYPHADFVLDCTDHSSLHNSVDRLIDIYFGHPFISPSKDEYCSYIANAASYRSLDLSRQVGAAIFSKDCEIISLGCNEVPKAGGGTYWSDSEIDRRDYALGFDSNQHVKQDMARDALDRLRKWLADKFSSLSADELSKRAFDRSDAPLKGAMISDVIEYGRMVHAEMNAISDAARSHKSTQDGVLYCTTMPCHLCTKLIIASGIRRVVYVQPYSKSLVDELYEDSVCIDDVGGAGKVSFETLKGVAPNGFRIAFRKTSPRKNDDGSAIGWDPLKSRPIFLSAVPYYRQLELNASEELKEALSRAMPTFQEKLDLIDSEQAG